jgi:FHS family L-fucose permease-like MFS transporter
MIDVLNKHFQNSLQVTKAQSAFVQSAWYGGYFLFALPAGLFARKFGYRKGILAGLSIIVIGCLCFVPVTQVTGTQVVVFSFFLAALGLVSSGFTFIETIANPYATVLGHPSASVARINLAQSCNAVGWIFGPILGGSFILSKTAEANTSNANLYLPYLIVAGIVTLLILSFLKAPVPEIHAPEDTSTGTATGHVQRPLVQELHSSSPLSRNSYTAQHRSEFSASSSTTSKIHPTCPPCPPGLLICFPPP